MSETANNDMKTVITDGETDSLEQLWIRLGSLAKSRADDNALLLAKDGDYPLDIRELQVQSAQAILDGIKEHHTRLRDERTKG
jgi:hypothetical protein